MIFISDLAERKPTARMEKRVAENMKLFKRFMATNSKQTVERYLQGARDHAVQLVDRWNALDYAFHHAAADTEYIEDGDDGLIDLIPDGAQISIERQLEVTVRTIIEARKLLEIDVAPETGSAVAHSIHTGDAVPKGWRWIPHFIAVRPDGGDTRGYVAIKIPWEAGATRTALLMFATPGQAEGFIRENRLTGWRPCYLGNAELLPWMEKGKSEFGTDCTLVDFVNDGYSHSYSVVEFENMAAAIRASIERQNGDTGEKLMVKTTEIVMEISVPIE